MSVVGNDGKLYSYDSDDLIEALEWDIDKFGFHKKVYAVYKQIAGIRLYIDYSEAPIDRLEENNVEIITLGDLMNHLEQQNSAI